MLLSRPSYVICSDTCQRLSLIPILTFFWVGLSVFPDSNHSPHIPCPTLRLFKSLNTSQVILFLKTGEAPWSYRDLHRMPDFHFRLARSVRSIILPVLLKVMVCPLLVLPSSIEQFDGSSGYGALLWTAGQKCALALPSSWAIILFLT